MVLDAAADNFASGGVDGRSRTLPDGADKVLWDRGVELSARGQYQEALRYLQQAVELSPGNPDYLNSFAWALVALGRGEEALMAARKAADGTVHPYILDTLAHAEYMTGNWNRAAQAWLKILDLNPRFYAEDADPLCAKDMERFLDAQRKAGWKQLRQPPATPKASR
jgi:tetratricopeptide (TPR) repeat protein